MHLLPCDTGGDEGEEGVEGEKENRPGHAEPACEEWGRKHIARCITITEKCCLSVCSVTKVTWV